MIAASRGDVVVLADRSGRYTGKPRPALVLRADAFSGTVSIIVWLITSIAPDAPLLRIALLSDATTGVERPSLVQLGKMTAVGRDQVGQRIGAATPQR